MIGYRFADTCSHLIVIEMTGQSSKWTNRARGVYSYDHHSIEEQPVWIKEDRIGKIWLDPEKGVWVIEELLDDGTSNVLFESEDLPPCPYSTTWTVSYENYPTIHLGDQMTVSPLPGAH